jgi:hypothetical protein
VPASAAVRSEVLIAVRSRIAAVQKDYPGVTVEERGEDIHVTIPDALRVGHEAHFAQVMNQFLRFVRDRRTLPGWERPNMLAKYFVTTSGRELSYKRPPQPAPRLAPR